MFSFFTKRKKQSAPKCSGSNLIAEHGRIIQILYSTKSKYQYVLSLLNQIISQDGYWTAALFLSNVTDRIKNRFKQCSHLIIIENVTKKTVQMLQHNVYMKKLQSLKKRKSWPHHRKFQLQVLELNTTTSFTEILKIIT